MLLFCNFDTFVNKMPAPIHKLNVTLYSSVVRRNYPFLILKNAPIANSCMFCGSIHRNKSLSSVHNQFFHRTDLNFHTQTQSHKQSQRQTQTSQTQTQGVSEELSQWRSVVGLEIHAQIKTTSKLFSGSATNFGASANTQVALFDAAFPGTLPVLNKKCVESAVRTAQALGCKINKVSRFDRKHYFYADMPAGYQITQHRQPLAYGGSLQYVHQCSVTSRVQRKEANLVQIQLEQDSGKSLHDLENNLSLVDLNRAGVGLMEIVTEPDFTCGDDAASFVKDLRDVLIALGTCDGRMAEGSLRVDANVSVHRDGEPWGTRTEVKNINSTRNIRLAIDSEIERQITVLESGGVIQNETRSFNAEDGQTVSMRDKEKILDYRFMPEPNLPPVVIHFKESTDDATYPSTTLTVSLSPSGVSEEGKVVILPEERRRRLEEKFGVALMHSVVLVRQGLSELFEKLVVDYDCDPRAVTSVLKTQYQAFLDDNSFSAEQSPISISKLVELIKIFQAGRINSSSVSVVLNELALNPDLPCAAIVEQRHLWLEDDIEKISSAIDTVLAKNPQNVKSYRKGKTNQLKVFTSKVMKMLEGKANTATVQNMIKDKLDG